MFPLINRLGKKQGLEKLLGINGSLGSLFGSDLFADDTDPFDLKSLIVPVGKKAQLPEVKEDSRNVYVTVGLQGLMKQDISVSVKNRMLTISGERSKADKNNKQAVREYSSFRKSVFLPAEVDARKLKKSFKRDLITITVPKKQGAKKSKK